VGKLNFHPGSAKKKSSKGVWVTSGRGKTNKRNYVKVTKSVETTSKHFGKETRVGEERKY